MSKWHRKVRPICAKIVNVFTYYQRKLEEYDVKSYEEFAKIIHAYRAKQSRARIKQREGLSKWRR